MDFQSIVVYFNESGGWTLEIDNVNITSVEYIDSLILECNSGSSKITDFDTTNYIIVTNENLINSISLNKNADCIKLYSYSFGEYRIDSVFIGDISNSYLKHIENGQSITRLYGYGPFYKDNSPTIGLANDLEGSKGKIYGNFYDIDGALITDKYFFINEGNCTPILQQQGIFEGCIEIDDNGFYCAEITSRSYSISERLIYTPMVKANPETETMQFQTVSLDLNENDSTNINFTQILTLINPYSEDYIF